MKFLIVKFLPSIIILLGSKYSPSNFVLLYLCLCTLLNVSVLVYN